MKKLITLILTIGLFGCGTIPVKDSPPPDLARMAEQGSVSKARVFTSLLGGVSGSLDNIAIAGISDNDLAWVIDSSDVLYFYRFEASSTTAESSPYFIRPDDYSSAGVWYLISTISVRPTATPSITGRDSDQANDPTWSITGNSDGTDGDMDLKVQVADSLVTFITLNGQGEDVVMSKDVNPVADGTLDLGTETTAQWANVWADAVNGADYTFLNGWRMLEAEKYEGYPRGIAIGRVGFTRGVVTEKMPPGIGPLFAITADWIEYKGIRFSADDLKIMLKIARSKQ